MWITFCGYKVTRISLTWIEDAIQIPKGTLIDVGMDIREFDDSWIIRPLSERVADGLIEVPIGKKLVDEKFVSMTQIERYQAGVDPIPVGMVLENDNLRFMTLAEQVAAGLITQDQADEITATAKREQRERLLEEYDKASAQLSRSIRRAKKKGEDASELEGELLEWDAWADALCDLPEADEWPYIDFPTKPTT